MEFALCLQCQSTPQGVTFLNNALNVYYHLGIWQTLSHIHIRQTSKASKSDCQLSLPQVTTIINFQSLYLYIILASLPLSWNHNLCNLALQQDRELLTLQSNSQCVWEHTNRLISYSRPNICWLMALMLAQIFGKHVSWSCGRARDKRCKAQA